MTMTPNDAADRLYSYAAGSAGSWSHSLCHAAGVSAFSLPAASEMIFPDCAAAAGTWLSTEPNNPYDRSCSVNVIPSDGLLATSLHRRSVSSTSPQQQQPPTQVRIIASRCFAFYRAMHVVLARYCYRKSSVCPFVCLYRTWAYVLG